MNRPGDQKPNIIIVLTIATVLTFSLCLYGYESSSDKNYIYHKAVSYLNANNPDSALFYLRPIASQQVQSELQIRTFLAISEIHRQKHQYDSAFLYLGGTKNLLTELNITNQSLWAEYYHKIGTSFLDTGAIEKAKDFLNKSIMLKIDDKGENDTNLVLSYNNLGIAYFRQGLFNQSLEYYTKALNIISLGEISKSRTVAMCFQNTGILFATTGDYSKAGEYFIQSLDIYESTLQPDDHALGRVFLNFGRMLQLSGRIDEALKFYNKAEKIFEKNYGPDFILIGSTLINKATIYNSYSDYERAFNYNNRALAIFQRNFSDSNHDNILTAYMNLGYYYEKKSDFRKAIKYYEKSINLERITPSNIKTYRNMANLYTAINDYELADHYFNKSIESSTGLFGREHPETALSYISYARFLTQNAYYSKSHELLLKAKGIIYEKHGENDRDYSNVLMRIGNNFLENGHPEKALIYFQEAIAAITEDFSVTQTKVNPTPDQLVPDQFLLNALYLKAKSLHHKFWNNNDVDLLINSLETYDLSIALLNRIRITYLSEESRLIITAITCDILTGALDCALELYYMTGIPKYLEKAFQYSEQGKAMVLLTAFGEIDAKQLLQVSPDIQRFERKLKYNLEFYNNLVYDERLKEQPDETKINLWQTHVFELNQQYDSLIQAIFVEYPDYYELRFDLSILSLPDLQKHLLADEVLIAYTLSDLKLFAFAVTPDTAVVTRFEIPVSFHHNLETLRLQLSGDNLHDYKLDDFIEFIHVSGELYNTLIKPFEPILKNQKLIIIPDNQLGYIPFEVLLTEFVESDGIDFRKLPYLLKCHPVSYAYSATILQRKPKRSNRSNGRIIAFAPNYGNSQDFYHLSSRHENLLPIPWAIDEIRNITRKYRGRAFIGNKATKEAFKEHAGNYQILHLAMHSIINNDNPMYSKLVFSPIQDTLNNGFLNTYDLFNLELNARLAVLSACQTGDGRLQRGEGIMSMARGFLNAGIPAIIMTLWEIDDHSSSKLILHFYDYLAEGYEKNKALRSAKLDYLQTTDRFKAHPHFWAGFVNIGSNDPILVRKLVAPWLQVTSLLFLIAVSAFLILWFRKGRTN